ncbi:uncharacterized protein LOC129728338 [Wyeomyia smithii]|uniref:uncharacterized protein LOC129728338 n=1 Tax=Wyeomyia smithii TaxID=174621 RepID=UPI002467AD4B|nr:uncharacterized protein LOC129728338 [Wyeomyia smithii]
MDFISYPTLASSSSDVPQALWFHANARGRHKHSGRLHYHMEYLARKSGERKVRRVILETQSDTITDPLASTQTIIENIEEMRLELKFLCPSPKTKERAVELWQITFDERNVIRQQSKIDVYMNEYPVFSAFNGLMIELDFTMLMPSAKKFAEEFESIKPKILQIYHDAYLNISNAPAGATILVPTAGMSVLDRGGCGWWPWLDTGSAPDSERTQDRSPLAYCDWWWLQ